MTQSNSGSVRRRPMTLGQVRAGIRNHRIVAVGLVSVITAVVGLTAVVLIISALGTSQPDGEGGSGGGGQPDPELVAVLNSLPVYPGAPIRDLAGAVVAGTAGEAGAVYLVQDEPQQVSDFYDRALPGLGWTLDQGPRVTAHGSSGGRQVTASYIRESLRLDIAAKTGTKEVPPGQTVVGVLVVELH